MLENQRQKLYAMDNKTYLSIGISDDGTTYGQYPVPWVSTANAYNMKLPDIYISKDDIYDKKIMDKIKEFKVNGCYIFCPLDDYVFLNSFHDIFDLNIYFAYNLTDLSFLTNFTYCRLLFISNAHLKNVNEVFEKNKANPKCLALYNCVIDDISYLKETNYFFSELVVSNPKSRDERARWAGIKNLKYFDFKEEPQ